MESVTIKASGKYYTVHNADTIAMDFLGFFLTDDVGCYWPGFKKWALDPNQISSGGNFSTLEKENGYVLIGEDAAEDLDAGPFCKIPLDEFIKILDQWEQFCKTKPKEILITRENDTFKMEAIF